MRDNHGLFCHRAKSGNNDRRIFFETVSAGSGGDAEIREEDGDLNTRSHLHLQHLTIEVAVFEY